MPRMSHDDHGGDSKYSDHIIEALCFILGNTGKISRIARCFRWNTEGIEEEFAKACFSRQADELHAAYPVIAEHIRTLGSPTVFDYTDVTVEAHPPTRHRQPDIAMMFSNLALAHEQACLSIEAAIEVASEFDDPKTSELLEERLRAHRDYERELTDDAPANINTV